MPNRCSITEALERLPALVQAVEAGGTVELTRRGRPVAVLISVDAYRGLNRTRPGLWPAFERFRATTDLEALDVDAVLEGVRDRSPGRDFAV